MLINLVKNGWVSFKAYADSLSFHAPKNWDTTVEKFENKILWIAYSVLETAVTGSLEPESFFSVSLL